MTTPPLQPLLHDELVVLRAPTQLWSAPDGSMGARPIHGVAFSDVRLVRELDVRVGGATAEHLGTSVDAADHVTIHALLRQLDDPTPDPGVRLAIDRRVGPEDWSETLTVRTRHDQPVTARIEVLIEPDATFVDALKQGVAAGAAPEVTLDGARASWSGDGVSAALDAEGFALALDGHRIRLTAELAVPARGSASVSWRIGFTDAGGAVRGTHLPRPWGDPDLSGTDPRLARWGARALDDLDALRMTLAVDPERQFLAAGAPWFFTLFGRDSIWAARLLLPWGVRLAGDTLHVLARLQGGQRDDATAEEPGKIMHEIRRQSLVVDDGTVLPPLYYGTVDATPLWVCLLHEAWQAGLAESEVRELMPALEAALGWMRDHGDADGDGLLEYIDRSGHGLANQGWKDSGDSVQWRDGRLAEGPIALCEVQAYAYQAALAGAELLERFGGADAAGASAEDRAAGWRAWAARLRERFHEEFWITDPAITGDLGPYPAIALDAAKRPVDTVTSNLGHLLGTGLLDAEQSRLVAARLGSPVLDSGYGLRTMSTDSAGYWPFSYHGGSVWAHDTAIAIRGLVAEGHLDVAGSLVNGLAAAAEGFGYRMPELHSGDPASETARPIPYPAACRPQAWSAAAALTALTAARAIDAAEAGGEGEAQAEGIER
ncbi:glycogen debranching N-terminal domain-containing protein [Homoserinibacter sp. GY 40078]|uniref:glycogen debranching N-terminal domain-containing protein n=1 Tax=Homoserinibacter sp. GY 40078 TaxID=2603275 RepID=UPI0011CC2767|nr:glycogen debranching N-terminal domain-containing protein [Homoserinibacter sp. GY 40078]TXK18780.1 amylo-alpha-1,6-glucosidase [Homoserinibacter sp. GY 40078]